MLRSLFRDTSFPLVDHHLASFNALLETSIPTLVKVSNPYQLELSDKRYIRVYIGGKDGSKISFEAPVDEHGGPIVPHACRLDNTSYALTFKADIELEFVFPEGNPETKTFENIMIGQIPLMLRSKNCYLTAMDGYEVGECKYELGGYFVIDGKERVLLTQELLGNNMMYAGTRKKSTVKDTEETGLSTGFGFEEPNEYYVGIKSMSEDGSKGPSSHYLILPSQNKFEEDPKKGGGRPHFGRDRRLCVIQLPGFQQPVPILSVFAALGLTSDRDVYETIFAGVPDKDRIGQILRFWSRARSANTSLK